MSKVSIAMPLYNAEKYVSETVKSLLMQTYEDFELIIVDDASTDNSVKIVSEIDDSRIRLLKNSVNIGIAATRNRAIENCVGEYIALMDDDDIAPNYRIEKEVKFLDENNDIDVVGGHCRFIDENGQQIKNKQWNVFQNPDYIKAYLMLSDAVPNGSVMIRRHFINENNLKFLDNMYGAEDYRFWVECSLKGKIANVDEVMLYWRIGHDNETKRISKDNKDGRKKALEEIHSFALRKTGFQLEVNEIRLLNKVFDEEGKIESNEELKKVFEVLKKISKQAYKIKLKNANEITAMCRKRFGEKVGKAFYLWNQ